jgi:hypothetical protein
MALLREFRKARPRSNGATGALTPVRRNNVGQGIIITFTLTTETTTYDANCKRHESYGNPHKVRSW